MTESNEFLDRMIRERERVLSEVAAKRAAMREAGGEATVTLTPTGQINHKDVARWVWEDRISFDQGLALVEEARRRENVDPYEGTYLEGPPADAWPEWVKQRVWVVNAYRLTREYGGPEEGGWWYTRAEPMFIAEGPFLDVEDAEEVRDHLQAFADLTKDGDMYSVLGGSKVSMRVESCVPHKPVPMVYC